MKLYKWIEDNWYKLKYSLDWIDLNRYWDWMISVTTVLQLIYDPKFDYVLRNNKEAIDIACKKWTEEHLKAEKFFDANSWVTEMNPMFMKFISLYNVTPLKREETVYREYKWVKFRWTIDCIGDIDYPLYKWIHNIDRKNSKTESPKYHLQLSGYKWMNWYEWILVYGKDKLKVVHTEDYSEVWQELLDYFITLYLWQKHT